MSLRRFFAGLALFSVLALPFMNACIGAEASAPSSIPFKRESSMAASEGPRLVLGFGFCAVLLAGAIYLTRRRNGLFGKGAAGKRLVKVMETSRLGPKTVLYVVDFEQNRYLLAESANGVHCVANVPMPDGSSAEQKQ